MAGKTALIKRNAIQNHIFTARGFQVILDSHLADLYNVETRRLNEQVKRNLERFPEEFMFRLTDDEYELLRSQNAILEAGRGMHRKYLPYVFTEQGVAMLSAVLRSETAIKVSIQIIRAFVDMRKFIAENAAIFQRINHIERRQLEADVKFEQIFNALQHGDSEPKQGVFYDGQVFDAYTFVTGIVRKAKTSVILIDNYVDDTVLCLFTKCKKGVALTIYTKNISKQLALDIEKYNSQYGPAVVKEFKSAHDRFLIIDEKELYHIGASLKDLGKKWFAFSKMDTETLSILDKLKIATNA